MRPTTPSAGMPGFRVISVQLSPPSVERKTPRSSLGTPYFPNDAT